METTRAGRIERAWDRLFENREPAPVSAWVVVLACAAGSAFLGSIALGWPFVAVAFGAGFAVVCALWAGYKVSKKLGWGRTVGAALILAAVSVAPASATCVAVGEVVPTGVVVEAPSAPETIAVPQCNGWLGMVSFGSTILCGISVRAAIVNPNPLFIGAAFGSCVVALGSTGALASSCAKKAELPDDIGRILRERLRERIHGGGAVGLEETPV
ncbi:MAG: hypothetical protein OXU74_17130 [Gemmatimonadota bacterium]|nr:hypothetical protein [Gemmatimonadota bacterium]